MRKRMSHRDIVWVAEFGNVNTFRLERFVQHVANVVAYTYKEAASLETASFLLETIVLADLYFLCFLAGNNWQADL